MLNIARMFTVLVEATSSDEHPWIRKLRAEAEGCCGECGSKHPERVVRGSFWITFSCPECGHASKIHINTKNSGSG
jgi:transcription elongation factor Elf1